MANAKKPALTIEHYTDAKGEVRRRFLSRNGKNFEDGYKRLAGCAKSTAKMIAAIKADDYVVVDNTKKRRS